MFWTFCMRRTTRKVYRIWMEPCKIRFVNGKAVWYAWSFIATSPRTFNVIWTRRKDLFRAGSNTRQEWISGLRLQKGRGLSLKIASRDRRTRLQRDDYFPIRGKDIDDSTLLLAKEISTDARDCVLKKAALKIKILEKSFQLFLHNIS